MAKQKTNILKEVIDVTENICNSCGNIILENMWIDGNICPFCSCKR